MKALNVVTVSLLLCLSMSSAFAVGLNDLKEGLGSLVGKKKTPEPIEQSQAKDTSKPNTNPIVEPAADPEQTKLLGLVDQQEKIVKSYIEASLKLTEAQVIMAQALGLKKEAAKLEDAAKALSEGKLSAKDGLKKHHKVSEKTNKAIDKKLKKGKQLSKESQLLFASSMAPYARGLKKTKAVYRDAKPFFKSVTQKITDEAANVKNQGFSLTSVVNKGTDIVGAKSGSKKKLATGTYLITAAPKFMGSHGQTFDKIVAYSKSQNIEVDSDTVALLDDLAL